MKDYTHWHENIEIIYVTEGSGNVICNFKKFEVRKGNVFIINSENLHMVDSSSSIEYFYLIIDSDFLSSNGIPINHITFNQCVNDPVLIEKYMKIINLSESQKNFRDARMKIAILGLLERMLDFVSSDNRDLSTQPANLANVKMAIKYIKENSAKKMTIDEISEASGLSKAYLSRKFKAITGFTIVNYINLVRCQNASKLIRSGKFKINEAAIECGFDNMSYFTKTYKKYMNAYPSNDKTQSEF
jgi:AraC-like DNA-binding protein